MRSVYVGIDYHDKEVQACVLDGDGIMLANKGLANDWGDIQAFAGRFGEVRRVGIESCTGAAHLAEELVQRCGWSVDLAHPGYVHRMKQNPDKTDFSDARMLADLTRVGYLPRVWLAPPEVRELRRLVHYRQQLTQERRAIKLRIGALLRDQRIPRPGPRPWTLRWLMWLRTVEQPSEQSRWIITRQTTRLEQLQLEIEEVMVQLRKLASEDPMVKKLMQQPGIGEVTAFTMRAEIGRFDRFNSGKQLARFCGTSPRNASTGGRHADAGLIRAANGKLRAVVIEAAHRLARLDDRWKMLKQRLKRAGKPGSVVAAAIANRWLRSLYHRMQPAQP